MKMFPLLIAVLFGLAAVSVPWTPLYAEEHGGGHEGGAKKEAGGHEGGEGEKGKKAEDVSGGRFAGDPVFVHIPRMVMPVISDKGAEQIITFQLDVEVKDFDTADQMHTMMPRIIDALMRALYGGLGQGSLRTGKLVDVAKIKNKATTAIREVIGGDGVKNVLVQGVAQRML